MPNNLQFQAADQLGEAPGTTLAESTSVAPIRGAGLKVVYIAGDGRSGSTLLDRLIGSYPGVFSSGELGNLLRSMNSPDELCACGRRVGDCPFWRAVTARWRESVPGYSQDEYRALQRRYERMRSLLRPLWMLGGRGRDFPRYAEYTRALFSAIGERSGAKIIVDSTKNPAKALALSRVAGLDLRLLHLVRDVRGVAYSLRLSYQLSTQRGRFESAEPSSYLRFAAGWAAVNYFCERVRRRMQSPTLLMRYEDYTADPSGSLAAIAGWLGMPASECSSDDAYLRHQGHQVAGNEIRMRPVKRIATDELWRTKLGAGLQRALYLLVFPQMMRYRYRP